MYTPQFSSGTSLQMGSGAEAKFDKIAKMARIYSKKASINEERLHIDRIIDYKGKMIPIEIKAMKKISRSDPAPQDRYIWIELHGVHPNDKGWLYGGHAEFIAFEIKNGFMFVKRTDLINLVNRLVDFKSVATTPQEALNKVYARRAQTSGIFGEGSDLVTLIDAKKIEAISLMTWKV